MSAETERAGVARARRRWLRRIDIQIREVEDQIKTAEQSQWGQAYQKLGKQTEAGLNFSAGDLEALKKKYGIQ